MLRHIRQISIVVLIMGAMLGGWFFYAAGAMEVTIRLTGEGGKETVTHTTLAFSRFRRPVKALKFDLSPYAGKLVRIDVAGAARNSVGFIGCSVTHTQGSDENPVEFIGWSGGKKERFHPGAVGPMAYRGPERAGHVFVYGKENKLWSVFPAGKQTQLTLYLTPILTGDVTQPEQLYIPPAPAPWAPAQRALASHTRPPDVYIYLIDALRADHLGCYGYPRPTSPAIDAFARTAVLYEQANTTSTWTRPSVASLWTGLYPLAHGVMHLRSDKLSTWPVTLPLALHQAGYRTLHVTTNVNITEEYGFLRGVDRSVFADFESAQWVTAQAVKMLQAESREQPVFMYLHTLEPHGHYMPQVATYRRFNRDPTRAKDIKAKIAAPGEVPAASEIPHLFDLYDAEIRDNDAGFAGLLDVLRRTGRLDNSLIIVVADHGEAFGEHGTFYHGNSLNEEEMHVPLIIRYPYGRYAGVRVKTRVSLVDIFPTIMAVTGVTPLLRYGLPGRELQMMAAPPSAVPERPIYAEVSQYRANRSDLVGVIDPQGYKRVCDLAELGTTLTPSTALGLWNTAADPQERSKLLRTQPVRAAYDEILLAHYLMQQRWWRGPVSTGQTESAPLTPVMREHLENLGYLK